MKATGVVRRIDELGRIVIPKEIRKNFRIKDGENIEIYIDDEENIILKKHSILKNIKEIANIITDSIYQINNKTVLITDTNNIISISKDKKELLNNPISNEFLKIMNNRIKINESKKNDLNINEEMYDSFYIMYPIISNGDLIGSIVLISDNKIDNIDSLLLELALKILLKYIEQ